jgi:FtsH-binding integral membrane protein
MAFETERSTWTKGRAQSAAIDVGLREYMLRVYNYMASGLALTGIVAYGVANTPALQQLFFQVTARGGVGLTGLGWIATLAPLGLVLALSFGLARMRASTAQGLFWVYAGLMGVSLSSLLLVYTGASVARTFFITAASFGGLSLWGYTTRRDLTGFGSFLMIGLIGIILASLVNMFFPSGTMTFIISIAGVLIFAGLTAYDTQKIKELYWGADDAETMGKKAVMGALTLYLDFINLFVYMLRFLGDRRD